VSLCDPLQTTRDIIVSLCIDTIMFLVVCTGSQRDTIMSLVVCRGSQRDTIMSLVVFRGCHKETLVCLCEAPKNN
jgi:hypothetical protein